jgi:hypothetical protein
VAAVIAGNLQILHHTRHSLYIRRVSMEALPLPLAVMPQFQHHVKYESLVSFLISQRGIGG